MLIMRKNTRNNFVTLISNNNAQFKTLNLYNYKKVSIYG